MSNYVKTVDFAAKDPLLTGNPTKAGKGTEVDTEFNNIATAVSTKEDTANKNIASGYAGLDGSAHLAASVMPALTGDVTTSAGAVATTIAASAVTLAKMANLVAVSIIGRAVGAGTGVPQALSNTDIVAILNTTTGLATSVITSGTFANALIAAGNVTQHQAALAVAFTQITGTATAGQIPSLDTSKITTGTFADARIASSNVTQFQTSIKGKNVTGKSGVSFTIQSGGTATGGSDGDIIGIY